MKTGEIPIAQLRRDGGTQIRAALDEDTVTEYAAIIREGGAMPPVLVVHDGKNHWVVDGFHRIEAALRAGKTRQIVESCEGTLETAILEACGANQRHGLRRSTADKRRAVETMLAHPVAKDWSLRRIADHIGVSHEMVATHRSKVSTVDASKVIADSVNSGITNDSPQSDGGEGAGAKTRGSNQAGSGDGEDQTRLSAPAPDEPCRTCHGVHGAPRCPGADEPPIDMLGLTAPADWLEGVAGTIAGLERISGALTALVGAAGAIGAAAPVVQAARQAVQQAGATVRALTPVMACAYCRDPGGKLGRRAKCSACGDLGWLTKEQAARVPPAMAKAVA